MTVPLILIVTQVTMAHVSTSRTPVNSWDLNVKNAE